MKKYIHKGIDWYVLGTFDNRSDATTRKYEVLEMMNVGKIAKGTLEIIDGNKHIKTNRGMRKGKFYLLGRTIS